MRITLAGPASPVRYEGLRSRYDDVPFGYAPTPVDDLAIALSSAGHDVCVVTGELGREEVWTGTSGGLTVICVPFRSRPRDRIRDLFSVERQLISAAIDSSTPDVVHAHWSYEFSLAALAVDARSIVTAHDAPLTVLRHYKHAYRVGRLAMAIQVRRQMQILCTVSPYLSDRWRREMCWRGLTRLLPNMAPRDSQPSDRAPVARTAVTVGNSDKRKNVATLLEAWETVRSVIPSAELRVVGVGSKEELGYSKSANGVIFLGRLSREELAAELSRAEIMVHPSLEECHPVSIVEAMAAGIPTIGGMSSGGVPWTLDGGRSGLLCDVRSPSSIAESVVQLFRCGVLRDQISGEARRRCRELFDEEVVTNAHTSLYQELSEPRP